LHIREKYGVLSITMVKYLYKDAETESIDGQDYGFVVVINCDGTKIAVSDPEEQVGAMTGAGAVYIYDFDGSTMSLDQKLEGSSAGEYLGCALSFNETGEYLAIGSTGGQGKIQVYKDTGTWNTYGSAIDYVNEKIGYSVALSQDGQKMAAGYNLIDSSPLTEDWHVGLYAYNAGTWDETDTLSSVYTHFGTTISLKTDLSQITIGADRADNGSVDDAGRYETYNIVDSPPFSFGTLFLATDGDDMKDFAGHKTVWATDDSSYAVSAPQGILGVGDYDSPPESGKVSIYTPDGFVLDTIQGENPEDLFGWAVDTSEANSNYVAVGAPGYDRSAAEVGKAYVYHYDTSPLSLPTEITVDDLGNADLLPAGSNYGRDIALADDGCTLAVTYNGGVHVYVLVDDTTTTMDPSMPSTTQAPTTTEDPCPDDAETRDALKYWTVVLNGIC
jgi:hypothetical protein